MDFRPLSVEERQTLSSELRRNGTDGALLALRMSPLDTSWVPGESEVEDREVISLIRSVPCHYTLGRNVAVALEMLRGSPEYVQDAREGVRVGNSVVGSLLSLPPHNIPRQYAEQAVAEAIRILDSSRAESIEPDNGGNYTLPRSGKAPLRFQGELLAELDGSRLADKERTRWHELAVYRTAGGGYVVAIAYRTRYQGEVDHDCATVLQRVEGVAETFRDYDPCAPVEGFPASNPGNEWYEARQSRLLADIRRRYESQVSEILGSHPEFAEKVE